MKKFVTSCPNNCGRLDDDGTCVCGRIVLGIDQNPPKVVPLPIRTPLDPKASNICTEDGSRVGGDGDCGEGHERVKKP